MNHNHFRAMVTAVLCIGFSTGLLAAPAAPGKPPAQAAAEAPGAVPSAASTLKLAEKENKHALVLVYRSLDVGDGTEEVRELLAKLSRTDSWKKKAVFYQLDLSELPERDKEFADEYQLKSAPLPLTLVFAPNGAMVKYFVRQAFDEKALESSFAGPVRAEVTKQLQEGNAVMLFAPGKDAKQNEATLKTARELLKRPEVSGAAAVVVADPKDPKAKDCFEYYSLNDMVEEATLYFLFAPSRYGGQVVGDTTDDELYEALIQAYNSGGFG